MSSTSVDLVIAAAVIQVEERLESDQGVVWETVNNRQDNLIKNSLPNFRPLVSKLADILQTSVFITEDGLVKYINVQGVLDILVKWTKIGKKTTIIRKEDGIYKKYPGVLIDKNNLIFYRYLGHAHPVAVLSTQSGFEVWMTMCDEDLGSKDLLPKVKKIISGQIFPCSREFSNLQFPKVDLVETPDISWLLGMKTTVCKDNERWPATITKAEQKTKLKINQEGAHLRSRVRINTTLITCSAKNILPPDHVIDQPFLFWLKIPNVSEPIGIAYITTEHWKDPGSLDM